uniref:Uncharacterized protein n=1 Tax=Oryza brachyantha TaxID=4533 RepID=J3M4F6_ORYBR
MRFPCTRSCKCTPPAARASAHHLCRRPERRVTFPLESVLTSLPRVVKLGFGAVVTTPSSADRPPPPLPLPPIALRLSCRSPSSTAPSCTGHPLSLPSLALCLSRRSPSVSPAGRPPPPVPMNRFRPNTIVDGCHPILGGSLEDHKDRQIDIFRCQVM